MPYIEDYVRADGTRVRGHYRWAAGARHEMALFAVAAMTIIGIGNGATSTAADSQQPQRPEKTATYPIRFSDSGQAVKPQSQKPATYPIRFPKAERKPATQRSVSYPIHFQTIGSGR
ncbi:hypothetical protein [Streptomyces nanshensis]|uniref:Uncharacterized protein n=1 Tax=Streptomyces nanshensis TaxID=518642 RepID=A0A1E7L449_9ACTN|nr:hypothetical protein [Streptomyces nanshensis]OEV10901.1 hypothetical protein AN218_15475 [Streptomyces nanshensis]